MLVEDLFFFFEFLDKSSNVNFLKVFQELSVISEGFWKEFIEDCWKESLNRFMARPHKEFLKKSPVKFVKEFLQEYLIETLK